VILMIVCYGFVVKAQKMNCWKPFPQQTFLETIPTAKWFWSTTHKNHFPSKLVLEYNSQKPFSLQNGFRVQLTETISIAKWFMCWDLCTVHKDFLMHHNQTQLCVVKSYFGDELWSSSLNNDDDNANHHFNQYQTSGFHPLTEILLHRFLVW